MQEPSPSLTRINDRATAFTEWAELGPAATPLGAITGIHVLSELLGAAISLPPPEGCESDAPDPDTLSTPCQRDVLDRAFSKIPFQFYMGVYDPFEVPSAEATVGDIFDDLADIHRDLSRGLSLFRAGNFVAAHHHYFQSFYSHWGEHLTDAIRVLFMSIRDSQLERSWTFL